MKDIDKKTRFALFALAATFFAIGVTEFISVGVLPAVSEDFGVSTSTAGLVTSIYALGVAIGAPVLAMATRSVDKRTSILGAIAVFAVAHVMIAAAPTFPVLLAGRFIAATAHGLLFALSSTIAAELVGESRQARAIAFVFGGFTIATAIGAPAGTAVGALVGWRVPFAAIAVLAVAAFALNAVTLPRRTPAQNAPQPARLSHQLALLREKHVLTALSMTVLGYGGTFATFTYLSPILEDVTGVPAGAVSLILVLYGVSIAAGNLWGGRLGDADPVKALLAIFGTQTVALLAFYFTAHILALALINIVVLGVLAFMSVPILQSYVLTLAKSYAPQSIELASSLNITSFNLGIFLGSSLGGAAVAVTGLASTALVAAALLAAAVLLAVAGVPMERRRLALATA